ncbi:type VI secretion system protein ImpL [Geomonas sp. RF6]|uniref:type VI secretion protein IcmF/TssM N-terminal domain-containing protein n=1 Tax=Geomonas sp. RF6 TaxID=2897342 RepID=UPI001E3ACC20|nr:type VI secretion protein IcmF/TssM N-terminal domain-containing protein [Geomonas sp. RF6]UFS69189.1 type VI secretion system protein ImpL [Geomonas sp. RF6]
MNERTRHLLEIAVLLLLLAAAPLVARWISVPPWVALCLLVFLAGICVALFFLRSIMGRRCEAKLVHKELEEESELPQEPPPPEETALEALQEKWRVALEKLQASHLKKMGDPVHALPWYLALGAGGSGKSSMLHSSRLCSPFFSPSEELPPPTRNCDFWFFEKSVFIDTAGRYSFPVDEKEDREEWEHFLTLLAKHRRKEPLNGVVITVAADRLLSLDPDGSRGEARVLRQRVDELMRIFKVKFPVYVLVTKCDLIEGMERFSALLPERTASSPMGRLNERISENAESFTAGTIAAVQERLRFYRLQLLNDPAARREAESLALFPEEFALLKEPLTIFMTSLFKENPYQEPPVLRGLFFGSALQKGYPLSLLSGTMHPASEQRQLPGTDRGFFLQELFATVMPRDRSLLSPTRQGIRWRAMTADLAFMSWALVMIALSGLLGFSFIKNLRTIRVASAQLAPPVAAGSDLEVLERYRAAIATVEGQNRGWMTPRLGLTGSIEVERGLKEKFCRRFRKTVLSPLDKDLEQNVALLHSYSPDATYCQYAMHLVRRLNILRARIGGAQLAELQKKPLPAAPLPVGVTERGGQEPGRKFGQLYLSYLAWSKDGDALKAEAQSLQARLRYVLAMKEGNLRWLCHWVEHNEGLTPLTLAPFWGGVPSGADEPVIYPTYTRKGMARLSALVGEVEGASGGKGRYAAARADLENWQRNAAFVAWQTFAQDFSRGVKRLRGNNEWQRVASVIGTEQGPYLALMNRLTWELEPLSHGTGVPVWLRQLYLLQGARTQRAAPYDGIMAKAADTGAPTSGGIKQKLSRGGGGVGADPLQETAAAWREYLSALGAIAPAAASRGQSFQLAAQTFTDDPATGRSPFFAAYHSLNRIRLGVGADSPMAEVPARLVAGPMEFLWYYIRKEAAAKLQEEWEEEVVPGGVELPTPQATQVLLGPDGLAWKFAKGPAAPFLVRTDGGFKPKEVLGATLPLDGAFFSFMSRGTNVVASALSRQASYTVGIKALPSEANQDATSHPHATRLDLLCAGNTQSLVNLNYPTGKTFYWAPENCSDVVLKVEVGDLVLTKRYGGPRGFPAFLNDFRGGSRTFATSEFPAEAGALQKLGIKHVRVNYTFTGSAPVLRQSAAAQAHVPRSIGKSY